MNDPLMLYSCAVLVYINFAAFASLQNVTLSEVLGPSGQALQPQNFGKRIGAVCMSSVLTELIAFNC